MKKKKHLHTSFVKYIIEKYKPKQMKLKQYKIIDGDIIIYGKGKTIKNDDLFSLFEYCNLQQLKEDFTNKTIDNYLLNSWDVMYYFEVKKENGKNFVFTFSVFEYDGVLLFLNNFKTKNSFLVSDVLLTPAIKGT